MKHTTNTTETTTTNTRSTSPVRRAIGMGASAVVLLAANAAFANPSPTTTTPPASPVIGVAHTTSDQTTNSEQGVSPSTTKPTVIHNRFGSSG